jgi:hypothetical protein
MNSTSFLQTQLIIDTHMTAADTKTEVADTKTMVADTQTMVAGIYRKVLTGQEGTPDQNHSVGAICHSSTPECSQPFRSKPGQRY